MKGGSEEVSLFEKADRDRGQQRDCHRNRRRGNHGWNVHVHGEHEGHC